MDNRNGYGQNPNPSLHRRMASQTGARQPATGSGARSGRTGASRGAPNRQPEKKLKTGGRWFRAIVMVLATVALCVFLAIFILESANDLFGLNQENQQFVIVIPQNATIRDVSELLTQSGVVEKDFTFQLYANLKYEDSDMQPGEYLFNSNMGYDEILVRLKTGDIQMEEVKITFIEGWSVYEIAKELEAKEVCDAQEFLDCLQEDDLGFSFMDELPNDSLRFRRLEGYVFPDTYEFFVGENVDSVARKFLRNFNSKITEMMRARMQDLNMTLDETITLASIIQKETGGIGGIDEMKRVSSVFHNRLAVAEQYPNLQSDVTRNYANDFIKPFHTTINQPMYDAYNTYVCNGLPVGPICNPSELAIEAALYPAETPYYFFVTDVQGQFYYAATLSEHDNNVALASRVEGEGEIHGIFTTDE